MNRLSVVSLALLVAVATIGCALPAQADKAAPSISSVSPSSVVATAQGFTLNVFGSNFTGNSVVFWNSSPRPTVTINSSQLQAFISSGDIAAAGTAQVAVVNPKPSPQQSNSVPLTIQSPPLLQITTNSLPSAVVQLPYSAAVANSGGVAPYSWKVASDQLPPGLALDATNGAIAGVPGQSGKYSFTAQVSDSSPTPQTASQPLAVSVTGPSPLVISTTSLPNGAVQTAYSATLAARGGTVPYYWSAISGALPAGLGLDNSTGAISGTPTQSGGYTFTVQLKDSASPPQFATNTFTITVANAALQITTSALSGGAMLAPYTAALAATGGTPPYSWGVASGSLPPGLALGASTGAITGTPSSIGQYSFTAQVKDSAASPQSASKALGVSVAPVVLQITNGSLASGQVQVAYSAGLSASGGAAPYSWSVVSGSLPAGVSLNASTGIVAGTPTQAGTFAFAVQVNDAGAQSAQKSFSVVIGSAPGQPLSIKTSALPQMTISQAYSVTLQATGGTSPYTWSVVSGLLPPGLTLAASSGTLSGTPSTSGQFSFTVRVKDAAAVTASQAYTVTIASAPSLAPLPLAITTTGLSTGTVGAPYAAQLQASGGNAPYTWALTSGALPPGLSLTAVGIISGTPSAAGNYSFAASVTGGGTVTGNFTLTVTAPPSTPPPGAGTYTSRTDLNAAPETIPTLCSPAPCTMSSSDLNANLTYLRVTDTNTTTGAEQFATAGSASQRMWNSNSTAFWVNDTAAGVGIFFRFNPSTQSATKIACTSGAAQCYNGALSTFGVAGNADVAMSPVNPYVVYGIQGSQIKKMDFSATVSNPAAAPTVTVVADASSCPGIPTSSGASLLEITEGDTRFATVFGAGQDTWRTYFVWDATSGCRWMDIATMTSGGNWGPTGSATLYNESGAVICTGGGCTNVGGSNYTCGAIHDTRFSHDGRWVFGNTHCSFGSLNPAPFYFWDVGTNNVYSLGDTGGGVGPYYAGSHFVMGFDGYFLNNDTDYSGHYITKRQLPPTGTNSFVLTHSQVSDGHFSWNNQTGGSLQPAILSNYQTTSPSQVWQDEIVGVSLDGSQTVYRFAHMYTRNHDGFNASGLANVSRDGKWAIFCSDWGGTSRNDVFLVPLK
jgi:hypothetical protein